MGTTAMMREPGLSVHEQLMREISFKDPSNPDAFRVLDHALVKRSQYYAAAEHLNGPKAGKVFAIMAIIGYGGHGDGMNFSYKAMTDAEGPSDDECPARILDLLSPVEDLYSPGSSSAQWSQSWRDRCRKRIDLRKAAPKVKAGDEIVFSEEITFRSEIKLRVFKYVKGSLFTGTDIYTGMRFRITNWRDRQYSVIAS